MPNDDETWKRYAAGVKKIRKKKSLPHLTSFPPRRKSSASDSEPKRQTVTPKEVPLLKCVADATRWIAACAGMTKQDGTQVSLDRQVEKNLRQGALDIEGHLDLHGMTQAEAYTALARFIAAQVKAGRRNLLIITGKGRGGSGVLRANLPLWLESLPEAARILALRPAAPKHGDEGAFYLILKRKKSDPK